jgi:hypothetical protein
VTDLIAVHRDCPALHGTLLDLPNPEETKAMYEGSSKTICIATQ